MRNRWECLSIIEYQIVPFSPTPVNLCHSSLRIRTVPWGICNARLSLRIDCLWTFCFLFATIRHSRRSHWTHLIPREHCPILFLFWASVPVSVPISVSVLVLVLFCLASEVALSQRIISMINEHSIVIDRMTYERK